MTVLPESFPFPSPHSFSLLLVETLSPHQEWCAVGVYTCVCVYTPPRAALRGWGSIGTPCVAGLRRHVSSGTPLTGARERREKRERREGKERRGEEGGKMGVKVRGGREVYAARACAGKYTPAPRLNALLMRSGLCPLRIGNER